MTLRQFGLFVLLVGLAFRWAADGGGQPLVTKQPQDFYGFLTDAFSSGQTYLKIAPNPALKDLANPWAGAQGIPRLHDASYFRDRYYVYFGPAPVLLLFLPWRVATGTFLAEEVGTAVFGAVGTVIAGALLAWAWRRWFSNLPKAWLILGLVLMTLGSRALVLAEDANVYQVPINCAFCCLMGGLAAATWAMATVQARSRAVGLGLASLAWGLAVASRPDYLPSLAALGIPLAYLISSERRGMGPKSLGLPALIAWTVGPAAIVGLGLACYNYVRFGELLQFGMKYQFTAGDQRGIALVSPGSFGFNLGRYLFSRPFYSAYFPFLVSEDNWGALVCTPLAALALGLPVSLTWRSQRLSADWCVWVLMLAAVLACNFITLSLLAISNERYFIDFLPVAIMLGVVASWRWLAAVSRAAPWLRRSTQGLIGGVALWTIGQGALMTLHNYADPAALNPLARLADRAVARVESWKGIRYGALTLEVRFPDRTAGTREPLLVSGHGADVVYVDYLTGHRIDVGVFHAGAGGPVSDPVAIEPGRSYRIKLDLGSLYPPKAHPALAAWPAPLADVLLRRLDVAFEGRTLLHGAGAYYPTDPGDIHLGRNPDGLIAPGRFTGELRTLAQAGVPPPTSLQGPPGTGPVRLTVRFPPFRFFWREPLISTGATGAGDLLYVAYLAPGVIRLGHDSWNGSAVETGPLHYDPAEPQVIEADLGSLQPMRGRRVTGPLALRFNHRLVLFTPRPFNASLPAEVVFGFNGCNATSAAAAFSGEIVAVERVAPIAAPPPVTRGTGPVGLALTFPLNRSGASEPLLATGSPNRGTVVFVHYLDDHRVALGYADGISRPVFSAPLALDYEKTHGLEISVGALYPPESDAAWGATDAARRARLRGTVAVALDGRCVLLGDASGGPADGGNLALGAGATPSPVGAAVFTGRFLLQQRLPLDSLNLQRGLTPVELDVRLPVGRPGRSEPLVVTGRTGAGDALYVHYVDGGHIRLGYDHWYAGGPLSEPIAVDYSAIHTFEISLGSLYPDLADAAWGATPSDRRRARLSHVSIKLDGRSVLTTAASAYRVPGAHLAAGSNPIGASSCDPVFSGALTARRADPD